MEAAHRCEMAIRETERRRREREEGDRESARERERARAREKIGLDWIGLDWSATCLRLHVRKHVCVYSNEETSGNVGKNDNNRCRDCLHDAHLGILSALEKCVRAGACIQPNCFLPSVVHS